MIMQASTDPEALPIGIPEEFHTIVNWRPVVSREYDRRFLTRTVPGQQGHSAACDATQAS